MNGFDSSMKLLYSRPAELTPIRIGKTWEAATLPLGNGRLGANVFGGVKRERITVNEETLWSGGRGSVPDYDGGNPAPGAAREAYEQIAARLLAGETLDAAELEALRGMPREKSGYDDGFQPLGELVVEQQEESYVNYRRTLDLDQALATVEYTADGTAFRREYLASHPDNVLALRLSAGERGKLSFTLHFDCPQRHEAEAGAEENSGFLRISGTLENNGLRHETRLALLPEGGEVRAEGERLTVTGADSAVILLTAATDYQNTFSAHGIDYWYRTGETAAQLGQRVEKTLAAAAEKGWDAIKKDHLQDYQALFGRVHLNLGQKPPAVCTDDLLNAYRSGRATEEEKRYLEVLLFQYGRYLLISASRADSQLPTTLQGIWNDSTRAVWNSDIHTNINLQMNYWLSGPCNLTECALPLIDYVNKLKEPGGRTVRIYTGATHGIMAHTQNTPFGYTAPGWEISTWGWSPAAATWLLQSCYDYYRYSADENILREQLFPMLQEQVELYEQLLREKDGRKIMPIALSPEIGPVTCGNTFEQSLIWQLYADAIQAAEALGEQVPQRWRETFASLKPIEIGRSGQIKEWYGETTLDSIANTSSHRHLSNLLGLFPGECIASPEELAAAKVSLNHKNFGKVGATGSNPEGGWTYGQMIPAWARAGEGENAYFCVSQMICNRLFENLWDFHKDAIFQIDGNYGYSAGVAEMLLQSHHGIIRLLPALPRSWASGSFSGLLAQGAVEASASWENGRLKEAALLPKRNGKIRIKNPFAGAFLANGVRLAGDEVTLEGRAGEIIRLLPA